jgi:hypothetical protein
MKTKLFMVVVFLMLVSPTIQAQDNKIRFGVLGGLNFQNINGKDASGDKLENNLKLGFHLGANAMIGIAPEFYFQPGLLLTTKATKSALPISTGKWKCTTGIWTLPGFWRRRKIETWIRIIS